MDLARERLYTQRIAAPEGDPAAVVAWMGAVQAQEYLGALWAVGLRTAGATAATVEQAIADRAIVRTWFMRGTIHFVAAADLPWMMDLLAPRMRQIIAHIGGHQARGQDEAGYARSQMVLARALADGRPQPRRVLAAVLGAAGFPTSGVGLSLVLQRAQADGLLCYGPRQGKQETFVLRDAWVPPAPGRDRPAALAAFARRYFSSHGPATLADFVWWSGLTTADARAGLAGATPPLQTGVVDEQIYWWAPPAAHPPAPASAAYLLPTYDEYIVGYRDRRAIMAVPSAPPANPRDNVLFSPTLVVDGQVVGQWRRTLGARSVVVDLAPFAPLPPALAPTLAAAAARYAAFLGLSSAEYRVA